MLYNRRRKKLTPGKPVWTRSINDLVDGANDLESISASAPMVAMHGPYGAKIQKDVDPGFWAKITGGGNPYSYQEVQWQGGTAVTVTGGRTGTTLVRPAYDANGVTSVPTNYIAFLRPGFPGEYIFQSVRKGSCTGVVTVTVLWGSTPISGATVTITLGASTIATGSTNGSGQVSFVLTAANTYTITVTKTGYNTYTSTFVFSCANLSVSVGLTCTTVTITGQVNGCGGLGIDTATVNIKDGASVVATGSTNSSGAFSITFSPAKTSYVVEAVKTRFTTATTGIVITCGATIGAGTIQLDPSSGYHCTTCCWNPLATTLYVSNAALSGTVTLTYNADSTHWPGYWVGVGTFSAFGGTVASCGGAQSTAATQVLLYLQGDTTDIHGDNCFIGYDINSCNHPPLSLCGPYLRTYTLGQVPDGCGDGSGISVTTCSPPVFTSTMTTIGSTFTITE